MKRVFTWCLRSPCIRAEVSPSFKNLTPTWVRLVFWVFQNFTILRCSRGSLLGKSSTLLPASWSETCRLLFSTGQVAHGAILFNYPDPDPTPATHREGTRRRRTGRLVWRGAVSSTSWAETPLGLSTASKRIAPWPVNRLPENVLGLWRFVWSRNPCFSSRYRKQNRDPFWESNRVEGPLVSSWWLWLSDHKAGDASRLSIVRWHYRDPLVYLMPLFFSGMRLCKANSAREFACGAEGRRGGNRGGAFGP